MSDEVAEALHDLEVALASMLHIARRAQHGSQAEIRRLAAHKLGGHRCGPFLFIDIPRALANAIDVESERCPSAPGSESQSEKG